MEELHIRLDGLPSYRRRMADAGWVMTKQRLWCPTVLFGKRCKGEIGHFSSNNGECFCRHFTAYRALVDHAFIWKRADTGVLALISEPYDIDTSTLYGFIGALSRTGMQLDINAGQWFPGRTLQLVITKI